MTPEDRETLEQMAAYATARAEWHPSLMDVTDPGWDLDDLVECVEASARWGRRALAIRAALVERTCGTCRHWAFLSQSHEAGDVGHCTNRKSIAYRQFPDRNDGCLKGWAPKEGHERYANHRTDALPSRPQLPSERMRSHASVGAGTGYARCRTCVG